MSALCLVRQSWQSTLSIVRECASRRSTLNHHQPPFVSPLWTTSLFLSISDMDQPSSSFHDLFKAALLDYENQTGAKLIEHPFAKQLETCESVDSIHAILKKQVQISRKSKGDDGKMKSLKSLVDVLYALFRDVLGPGIGLVHQKLFIRVPMSLIVILYRHSRPQIQYSLPSPFFLLYVPYFDPSAYLRHVNRTGGQRQC